jgi:indole-3-glycerol phosphate synthase
MAGSQQADRTNTEWQSIPERYPKRKSVMAVLREILTATRARVRELKPRRAALERAAADASPAPRWGAAFTGDTVGVIAEVKRRSPSAGAIAPALDPEHLARAYASGGAVAISVLTDGPHFGGSLADLAAVRGAVAVPVLRKDFLIDPVQLFESRAAGASAVLLIVRILAPADLRALAALARDLGLARLVEVHARAELDQAVAVGPEAIGVNSRDLDTMRVALDAAGPLLADIPDGILAVAESGIATRADVTRMAEFGAHAVLVGAAVAGAADPAAAVAALAGVPRAAPGADRLRTRAAAP